MTTIKIHISRKTKIKHLFRQEDENKAFILPGRLMLDKHAVVTISKEVAAICNN
jgi:hypothetical protein